MKVSHRSPLISTMAYLSIQEASTSPDISSKIVNENAASIVPNGEARRSYFSDADNRQKVSFVPDTLLAKASYQPIKWNGEPPAVNEKGLYGSRRFMFKGHKWERQLPEREQNLHDFKVKHDEKR